MILTKVFFEKTVNPKSDLLKKKSNQLATLDKKLGFN